MTNPIGSTIFYNRGQFHPFPSDYATSVDETCRNLRNYDPFKRLVGRERVTGLRAEVVPGGLELQVSFANGTERAIPMTRQTDPKIVQAAAHLIGAAEKPDFSEEPPPPPPPPIPQPQAAPAPLPQPQAAPVQQPMTDNRFLEEQIERLAQTQEQFFQTMEEVNQRFHGVLEDFGQRIHALEQRFDHQAYLNRIEQEANECLFSVMENQFRTMEQRINALEQRPDLQADLNRIEQTSAALEQRINGVERESIQAEDALSQRIGQLERRPQPNLRQMAVEQAKNLLLVLRLRDEQLRQTVERQEKRLADLETNRNQDIAALMEQHQKRIIEQEEQFNRQIRQLTQRLHAQQQQLEQLRAQRRSPNFQPLLGPKMKPSTYRLLRLINPSLFGNLRGPAIPLPQPQAERP